MLFGLFTLQLFGVQHISFATFYDIHTRRYSLARDQLLQPGERRIPSGDLVQLTRGSEKVKGESTLFRPLFIDLF